MYCYNITDKGTHATLYWKAQDLRDEIGYLSREIDEGYYQLENAPSTALVIETKLRKELEELKGQLLAVENEMGLYQ